MYICEHPDQLASVHHNNRHLFVPPMVAVHVELISTLPLKNEMSVITATVVRLGFSIACLSCSF